MLNYSNGRREIESKWKVRQLKRHRLAVKWEWAWVGRDTETPEEKGEGWKTGKT